MSVSQPQTVLFLYSGSADYEMGELVFRNQSMTFDSYNLTSEPHPNDLTNYSAVWVLHSLPTHAPRLNLSKEWLSQGRGLVVMSPYPELLHPDDQELLGVQRSYSYKFPLDAEEQPANLSVKPPYNASNVLAINSTFHYYGITALIHSSPEFTSLAEVEVPTLNYSVSRPLAGFFAHTNPSFRIVFSTLSSYNSVGLENPTSKEGMVSPKYKAGIAEDVGQELVLPSGLLNFFQGIGTYSISGVSEPDSEGPGDGIGFEDPSLDLGEVGPFLFILALLLVVLGFLTGRGRAFLFGLFAAFLGFIAHIAYTPSRRRLTRTDLLENDTRSRILTFVESRGRRGAHLREIQRSVGCGVSTLLWHLQTLGDFNLIESVKSGRYTLFFSTDVEFDEDEEFAGVLRSKMAKSIWDYLLEKKSPQSLASIAKNAKCHPETARYHLKKLEEADAIVRSREGKKTLYIISPKLRQRSEKPVA